MKTIVCTLVCMCSVLAFGQGMNGRPTLPPGFRNPALLPPGPEREAAEKLEQEHLLASREWGKRFMAERKTADKPNPVADEVKAATKADGSIDHSKLSPKTRERFDTLIAASILDSSLRGPSKRLIEIVGERPKEELARIAEAVGEVALQQSVRKYPFESVARAVRQLVGDGVKLTDEQLRTLLAVGPAPLWRLDK